MICDGIYIQCIWIHKNVHWSELHGRPDTMGLNQCQQTHNSQLNSSNNRGQLLLIPLLVPSKGTDALWPFFSTAQWTFGTVSWNLFRYLFTSSWPLIVSCGRCFNFSAPKMHLWEKIKTAIAKKIFRSIEAKTWPLSWDKAVADPSISIVERIMMTAASNQK